MEVNTLIYVLSYFELWDTVAVIARRQNCNAGSIGYATFVRDFGRTCQFVLAPPYAYRAVAAAWPIFVFFDN